MVADLDFPLRVEVCPTVREPDGLAMSSRNVYLEPADRARAVAIPRALAAARRGARAGTLDAGLAAARAELAAAASSPSTSRRATPRPWSPSTSWPARPVLIALAARVGGARLIDNVVIEPPAG